MIIIFYMFTGWIVLGLICEELAKLKERFFPADAEPDEPEEEQEEVFIEYDFYQVQQRLIRIQKTADQIQSIEHLITDIEITSPERHELPLEMRWADTASGQERAYHLLSSGIGNQCVR